MDVLSRDCYVAGAVLSVLLVWAKTFHQPRKYAVLFSNLQKGKLMYKEGNITSPCFPI